MAHLFNFRFLAILIPIIQAMKFLLLQAIETEVIPPGAWEVAKDFPMLVAVAGVGYALIKLGERMLAAQQENLKEVYGAHQSFVEKLILIHEKRQDNMEAKQQEIIESLTEIKTMLDQRERRSNLG